MFLKGVSYYASSFFLYGVYIKFENNSQSAVIFGIITYEK